MILEKLKIHEAAINQVSNQLSIDQNLLFAVIWEESMGHSWNPRLEPAYLESGRNYIASLAAGKLGITVETEKALQSFSWGLMQIMGMTAREEGFTGPLPQLCEPITGVFWGAKHLNRLLIKYLNTDDAIAAYNHGHAEKNADGLYVNQPYVLRVKSHIDEILKGAHS